MEVEKGLAKCLEGLASGEPVLAKWDLGEVVVLPKVYYDELLKAKNNMDYLDMLERSDRQYEEGKVVHKTMAELEAMAGG